MIHFFIRNNSETRLRKWLKLRTEKCFYDGVNKAWCRKYFFFEQQQLAQGQQQQGQQVLSWSLEEKNFVLKLKNDKTFKNIPYYV